MLSKTITAEQPELEKRKSEILQQEEELKVQLVNYEKSLLEVKNEHASIYCPQYENIGVRGMLE